MRKSYILRAVRFGFVMFILALATDARGDEEEPSTDEKLIYLQERVQTLERHLGIDDDYSARANVLRVFWDRGLCFESEDGEFTMNLSGKIHVDAAFMNGAEELDDFVESHGDSFDDGTAFRRARIGLSGLIYGRYIYKAAYDFGGGEASFKDVYVGMKDPLPNTTLKVGHFREPVTLQYMTSAGGLRFLERSAITALAPSRNTGVGLFGDLLDQRMTWAAGVFYNTDDQGAGGDDLDLNPTVRLTGLPLYDGDERLVHLGASYSYREEDDFRFAVEPETQMAPDLIDTDGFPTAALSPHLIRSKNASLFGGELAWVEGPFSAQAEYIRMNIDARGSVNPHFWGYYYEAGYFLTGEQRAYKRGAGVPGAVTPASDFLAEDGGLGAIELAARYTFLDLDHRAVVNGAEMSNYTAGINWFLNPSIRLTANYIHTHVEHQKSADLLLLRLAFDF